MFNCDTITLIAAFFVLVVDAYLLKYVMDWMFDE